MIFYPRPPDPSPHGPASGGSARVDYERGQASDAWRRALAEQQAGRPAEARRWFERAWRFTPSDQNLAFSLATARLMDGDAPGARELFASIAARHAVREVLCGWAASALRAGQGAEACRVIARALSACAADSVMLSLARACATAWCAVTGEGRVVLPAHAKATVALDGVPVRLGPDGGLPQGWAHASRLDVSFDGAPAIGSPIDLAAMRRLEGYAERTPSGIAGWAWHPGAPELDPVLTVEIDGRRRRVTANNPDVDVSGIVPLARPRGFSVRAGPQAPVRVLDGDGKDVWGSPLLPAARPGRAPRPRPGDGTTIVVPVYRGAAATLACLRSVIATVGAPHRIVVVNDASPDQDLVAALDAMAASGAIRFIASCAPDPARNAGFPTAANAGIRAARGTDVVLLNSDTVVYAGWLDRLRRAAYRAPDIGTVTPLSNDATIFTYPDPARPSPMPGAGEGAILARHAARANAASIVDAPTGHGFCLYIKAACLHATGLLREDAFAQGYGEENDFCQRAGARGWRHVCAPGVYVAHAGAGSFGAARDFLLRRNAGVLRRLHPAYHRQVDDFIAADPLAPARRRIDARRWRQAAANGGDAVLLITHDGSGGTGRVVRQRAAALRADGRNPVVLSAQGGATCVDAADFPNLAYRLPTEFGRLCRLLAAARPGAVEIHHLLGHDDTVTRLLAQFGLRYEVWVHDWQFLCPRLSFITPEQRFCGEAPARDCAACTARGDAPAIGLPADVLRARSAALLQGARRVVVASDDAAARLRRHFRGLRLKISPWQADPAPRAVVPAGHGAGELTVAVVGALAIEKGYGVLLDCARDAAARGLPLRFVVAGYTLDDTPLLETGRVFVTGPFAPGTARALIASTGAGMAFLPSIWPETWCYALSDAWDAGLDVAVFDIGAPAERVRRGGRGWVLPLGLKPGAVNDALLRLQGVAVRSGS